MTKAEQRIAICKDVLLKIRSKKIKPAQGNYVMFDRYVVDPYVDSKNELRDVIKGVKCTACARGSLFLSAIDKYDKCKLEIKNEEASMAGVGLVSLDRFDVYEIDPSLYRFFSKEQLDLIESAFEKSSGTVDNWGDDGPYEEAIAFGRQHRSPSDRLTAIMKNIIRNKGLFIPPAKINSKRKTSVRKAS